MKLKRARRALQAADGGSDEEALARMEIDTLLEARFELAKIPA